MAASSQMLTQIQDYYILELSLPLLPALPEQTFHYVYIKSHEPKIPDITTPRSLFLVNIPFDTTIEHIKHLFSIQLGLSAGRVVDVVFEGEKRKQLQTDAQKAVQAQTMKSKKRKRQETVEIPEVEGEFPSTWDRKLHRGGSNVVVVFVDRASAEVALKAVRRASKQKPKILWGEGVEDKLPPLGVERYLTHHKLSFPPKDVLLDNVNAYMTAYNAREEAQTRAATLQRQVPDADGFITVTKGGRNGVAKLEEAKEKLEKQKEKQKGLDDFYRFQSREKRKEKTKELLRQFEEDKKRVQKMKETKGRFNPET